jgi:hypothetical protein
MSRSSHSSRFYNQHNSGWAVQILKLLIEHIDYTAINCTFHIFYKRLCIDVLCKSWYICKIPSGVSMHMTPPVLWRHALIKTLTPVRLQVVSLPGSVLKYPWKWQFY